MKISGIVTTKRLEPLSKKYTVIIDTNIGPIEFKMSETDCQYALGNCVDIEITNKAK
jgi:hypothetical protein